MKRRWAGISLSTVLHCGLILLASVTWGRLRAASLEILVRGALGTEFHFWSGTPATVTLATTFTNATMFYTLDGSNPTAASIMYTGPFSVATRVTVRAIAYAADFTTAEAGPVSIRWINSLTAFAWGAGTMVLDPPGGSYLDDQVVRLTAKPADGWVFADWAGDARGTENPLFLKMDRAWRVFANFARPTLKVDVLGSGRVTRSPDSPAFAWGEQVTLTAEPGRNCAFGFWGDGNTENPRTIMIGADNHYTAYFTNAVPVEEIVTPQWDKTYNAGQVWNNPPLAPHEILATPDNGALVVGSHWHGVVNRLGAAGQVAWQDYLWVTFAETLQAAQPTGDGGFIVGGYIANHWQSRGGDDFWVIRVSDQGMNLWQEVYGGDGSDHLYGLAPTPDGGYWLAGTSNSGVSGDKSVASAGGWLVRIDSEGHKLLDQVVGDEILAIAATDHNRYFVGGTARASAQYGGGDLWVALLDSGASPLWQRILGGVGEDTFTTLVATPDGGCLAGGTSNSGVGGTKTVPGFGGSDGWLVKLDRGGQVQWQKTFGGSGNDGLNALKPTGDGGFFLGFTSRSGVGGSKSEPGLGGNDFWVVRIDLNGNKLWDRTYGTQGDDRLCAVGVTRSGDYLFGGPSWVKDPDGYWLIRLASRVEPVGVPLLLVNGKQGASFQFSTGSPAQVTMQTSFTNGVVYYTLDGSVPGRGSTRYAGPIPLEHSADLRAVATQGELTSAEAEPVSIRFLRALAFYFDNGGRIGIDPPAGPYLDYSLVTLTALPNPGWQFMEWRLDGSGTNPVLPVVMDRDRQVRAVFGATVGARAVGPGQVRLDPPLAVYPYDQAVKALALPDPGYFFALWGGDFSGNRNPLPFVVTHAPIDVAALFTRLAEGQAGLTVAVVGQGEVASTPPANVFSRGQTVTLTATPASPLQFVGWSGAAHGIANPITVLMDTSKTITANFAPTGSTPSPPLIDTQPRGGTVFGADRVQLEVRAQGALPLEYQWRHDGVDIPGATTPWWAIPSFGLADLGEYTVVVSNRVGTVTSQAARLTLPHPAGLVGRWGLDEASGANARDDSGWGNHATLAGAVVTVGKVGRALQFDGHSSRVDIPNSTHLNFAGPITLTAWVKPASRDGYQNIVAHGYTLDPPAEVSLRVAEKCYQIGSWDGVHGYAAATGILPGDLNQWVHLAGLFDGTQWAIYRNGVRMNVNSQPVGALPVGANWVIGASSGGADRSFTGAIDEVGIFNRALRDEEIAMLASPWRLTPRVQAASEPLQLDLVGPWGGRCLLERSLDLRQWLPWITNAFPGTGRVSVRDADWLAEPWRFYRVVHP